MIFNESKITSAAAKLMMFPTVTQLFEEVRHKFLQNFLASGGLEVHFSYVCSSSMKIGKEVIQRVLRK